MQWSQERSLVECASAMSTFSPMGLRSSNGMGMCVSVCVSVRACMQTRVCVCVPQCVCMCECALACVCGRNELNVYTMLAYPRISSFCVIHKHTHTRILKPFEDSEPTGLKVDIACALVSGLFHCSHTEQNCNRSSSEGINPVCLMVLTVQISLSPGSDCSDLFASWY